MQYLRKIPDLVHNKRALSPTFASVLLDSIIIVFGSITYYYANNITISSTSNYSSSLSNRQQSMQQEIIEHNKH
jgi:hypothetical protein